MAHIRKLPDGKFKAEVLTPQLLPSGRRKKISRTHTLKKIVKDWADDEEAKIKSGTWVDLEKRSTTLVAFARQWERHQVIEEETARQRQYRMKRVLDRWGHWRIADIDYLDVQKWVSDMTDEGIGPHAVASAVGLLGNILDSAQRTLKVITHNPARDVTLPPTTPHVDRNITDEEEAAMMAALPEPWSALVATLIGTGMRYEEAAGLHKFRLNLLRRELEVMEVLLRSGRVKPYPKRKASARTIPITTELRSILEHHLETQPGGECKGGRGHPACGPGALVFCVPAPKRGAYVNRPRAAATYENFRAGAWATALEAAQIRRPWPTLHDLRHTYGSRLADAGVQPHEIRDLMGHKNLAATDRYLHSGIEAFDRARSALERRRPEAHSSPVPLLQDQRERKTYGH